MIGLLLIEALDNRLRVRLNMYLVLNKAQLACAAYVSLHWYAA